MIPLSYRDEYMSALRALSQNASPTPLWRMIDRAQRWTSLMTWTGRDRAGANAADQRPRDPQHGAAANLHLRDPAAPSELR